MHHQLKTSPKKCKINAKQILQHLPQPLLRTPASSIHLESLTMPRNMHNGDRHRSTTIWKAPPMLSIWLRTPTTLVRAWWPLTYSPRLPAYIRFCVWLVLWRERVFGLRHRVLVWNIRLRMWDRFVWLHFLSETVVDNSSVYEGNPET